MTDSRSFPVPTGPLECPACHNADPAAIVLFAEIVEMERFVFEQSADGVPVFGEATSVHVDPGTHPPEAECRRCHTIWTPPPGTFELHLPG